MNSVNKLFSEITIVFRYFPLILNSLSLLVGFPPVSVGNGALVSRTSGSHVVFRLISTTHSDRQTCAQSNRTASVVCLAVTLASHRCLMLY